MGIGEQVATSELGARICYLPCKSLHQDEQGELAMWFACLISPPCKAPAIYITSNAVASSAPSRNKFDFDSLFMNNHLVSCKSFQLKGGSRIVHTRFHLTSLCCTPNKTYNIMAALHLIITLMNPFKRLKTTTRQGIPEVSKH